MNTIDVYSQSGQKIRAISVPGGLLSGPVRKSLLYYAVRQQLASRRRGTHATKTRGMVTGSTKKIYRQKGTGRARHGDIKAPIFVGGGTIFGPHPRNYHYNLPKTARRRSLQTTLVLKNREGLFKIIEHPKLEKIQTKKAYEFFKGFGSHCALLVIAVPDEVIEKSVRNLQKYKVLRVEGLNVFDMLKYEHLFLTEAAFVSLCGRLCPES